MGDLRYSEIYSQRGRRGFQARRGIHSVRHYAGRQGQKDRRHKGVSGVIVLTRDVPRTMLQRLDESQNALRIVREATEGK